MATEFIMPQLGLTMTEGTVNKWFKKVGQTVAAGEVLAEVSTDKITNQVEASASGTILSILVAEGDTAPVKAVLAVIGEPGERTAAPPSAQPVPLTPPAVPQGPAHTASATGGWVRASPLARKVARERGIDLTKVSGTGPAGRIVERDVLAFAAAEPAAVRATPLAVKLAADHSADLAALDQDRRGTKDEVPTAIPRAAATGTPLTGMRRIIAERMSLSWQTSPHVHLTVEVDMTEARQLKASLAQLAVKVSFTEMIVKCAAQALVEFPAVNDSLIDGKLVHNENIHIGVAVALDNGLIVPVIKNAEQKSLRRLGEEIAELSGRARQGKLGSDEYSGGTFTVSNLGMYGVDHFTPIINPPESAILGVCRVVERPVAVEGAVAIRPMLNLCLSFDHRLIDGALAARFMARLRQLLEQPLLLL